MAVKPPASLVRYLRDRRCVLFCGSGLSAWAKLPTWTALLREIVGELEQELQDTSNTEELNRLLDAGKLLEVADHCKEALGRRYNDILAQQLRGDKGPIPEPHKAIVQMPFAAVVTTNYDKLLERSFAAVGSLPKTPTHRDVDALGPLLFDGSFFILKAHGDIDRPDSMVLTTRDYQEIIHANPAFNSIFSAILLTKAVLFVGYSLNDPDFRLLLDRQLTVFRGNVPERFALMSGLGRVERDVLWRTAKIRVLPYDVGKHEQVLDFLHALLSEVVQAPAEAAAPPAAVPRVAAVEFLAPAGAPATRLASVTTGEQTVLTVRLSERGLDASVVDGNERVQGSSPAPDWAYLKKLMPGALKTLPMTRVLGRQLSDSLPPPIVKALGAVPAGRAISLRLSARVELLPWELCLIGDEFLTLRNPVVRAPVDLPDTARGYPMVRVPPRALVIGDPDNGPSMRLPGALQEVTEIASVYQASGKVDIDLLTGADVTFDSVAAKLASGTYDVVHFAGHAWFDEDLEPFLLLSDGAKLRSGELRSLVSPAPTAILVLNSHVTAFTPPGLSKSAEKSAEKKTIDEAENLAPGGQRSFIAAAAAAGIGVLIGTFTDGLEDKIAREIGIQLHQELANGQAVATALHRALLSASAAAGDNPSPLTYAISGYGDIVLVPVKADSGATVINAGP